MIDKPMTKICDFYSVAERLKTLNVIRSGRYYGEIAEFIAKTLLGMHRTKNCREAERNGHIDDQKVEVKYNGGKSITLNPDDLRTCSY
jgi:hypothetical protein